MSAKTWKDQPAAPIKSAIVVGAGPSGLVLGILLAKAGIPVTMLEASHKLDENPRAAHYAPSACYDLNRAGVLEDLNKQGFHPDSVCWRKPDTTLIGGIRNRGVEVDYPMVCLPLDRLDKLLLEHFNRLSNTEILFEHKVVDIKQDDSSASVEVELKDGSKKWLSADYIIGADGANSQIRRSLHGDLNYPGETLQHQIIATNVYYDFHKFGYWDSNFIIDPENWYMAAKITKDGLWRVTYGDKWGLSTEEYLARQPERYEKILPGNPKPGDYKLVSASPYKLHQRCADTMREGRFLLVADAGHLCNPL
jgi:2-polyprenyl-6-methoxyphenol hydroxylase-like FAD-dependent oxidoreductase